MGLLIDKYGLTEEQERKIVSDGLVSIACLKDYDIFKHWKAIRESYDNNAEAIRDCMLHFNVKRTTVYDAIFTHNK